MEKTLIKGKMKENREGLKNKVDNICPDLGQGVDNNCPIIKNFRGIIFVSYLLSNT